MEKDVPYIVFESTIARFERTIRRLIIVLLVVIAMLFISNALWVYEWTAYDYKDVTIDSQDGGNANYIGANGNINNGTSESKNSDKKE